jgi:NifB/MoaA-like Fe-S oxidoreductase
VPTSSNPAVIPPAAAEKARLCILAARMRTRRMTFTDIAAELGFTSAYVAKNAVSVGLGLLPSENFAEARREAIEELDSLSRETWDRLDSPPPMTTVSGKLVIDPVTGQPYPDRQAEIATLRLLLEINKERRKATGTDAVKQSVTFTGTVEDLRAEIERKQRELDAAEAGDGGTVTALPQAG